MRIVYANAGGPAGHPDASPELADVGRYARRVVRRFVAQARADEQPTFRSIVAEHLGRGVEDLPVTEEGWPGYEHVNVQRALDAWLAGDGREHRLVGLTDYRHRGQFGLGDLLAADEVSRMHATRPGATTRVARASGPDGATEECLRAALVLASDGEERLAALVRGPDHESDQNGVRVEVVATSDEAARAFTRSLRDLALERNVYRGQVVSFGRDMFGERGSLLRFRTRPRVGQDALILPEATFGDIRRQVVGVARSRDRLRAAGQHLKRGLLLYGPPGAGKTHTVRYLMSELADTTIVELTGESLHALREACSIARSLQPAMIVVEDVDLIAEQRDHYGGETPMLFTLLNEMDGLDEDADVVFLLTTNRADLLEPALAARPGRVDQAVHVPLPDAAGRRRLLDLYRGRLELDATRLDDVVERTDGVTASFLKELLRRAAVVAAAEGDDAEIRVGADDLDAALADLLDTRNAMTRAVLGFQEETP
ncbi:26S protease regulatory subunit [Nocardioides anomalus]|uniref:26S protease regulatory subunit n=1 Tax=Nocardioides anomalus TaxID=2712223 RepID=A0A6G6WBT6_9ACTN|nr:ATP-binding protein [Nocardioides anomalus]QIG42702.1 26S protease regulatory subunit [Nocardioides anomalus]